MFPATSNAAETSAYDFYSEENAPKWKGLFVSALQKVPFLGLTSTDSTVCTQYG